MNTKNNFYFALKTIFYILLLLLNSYFVFGYYPYYNQDYYAQPHTCITLSYPGEYNVDTYDCVKINTDNIVLNCNGNELKTAYPFTLKTVVKNLTIKNCILDLNKQEFLNAQILENINGEYKYFYGCSECNINILNNAFILSKRTNSISYISFNKANFENNILLIKDYGSSSFESRSIEFHDKFLNFKNNTLLIEKKPYSLTVYLEFIGSEYLNFSNFYFNEPYKKNLFLDFMHINVLNFTNSSITGRGVYINTILYDIQDWSDYYYGKKYFYNNKLNAEEISIAMYNFSSYCNNTFNFSIRGYLDFFNTTCNNIKIYNEEFYKKAYSSIYISLNNSKINNSMLNITVPLDIYTYGNSSFTNSRVFFNTEEYKKETSSFSDIKYRPNIRITQKKQSGSTFKLENVSFYTFFPSVSFMVFYNNYNIVLKNLSFNFYNGSPLYLFYFYKTKNVTVIDSDLKGKKLFFTTGGVIPKEGFFPRSNFFFVNNSGFNSSSIKLDSYHWNITIFNASFTNNVSCNNNTVFLKCVSNCDLLPYDEVSICDDDVLVVNSVFDGKSFRKVGYVLEYNGTFKRVDFEKDDINLLLRSFFNVSSETMDVDSMEGLDEKNNTSSFDDKNFFLFSIKFLLKNDSNNISYFNNKKILVISKDKKEYKITNNKGKIYLLSYIKDLNPNSTFYIKVENETFKINLYDFFKNNISEKEIFLNITQKNTTFKNDTSKISGEKDYSDYKKVVIKDDDENSVSKRKSLFVQPDYVSQDKKTIEEEKEEKNNSFKLWIALLSLFTVLTVTFVIYYDKIFKTYNLVEETKEEKVTIQKPVDNKVYIPKKNVVVNKKDLEKEKKIKELIKKKKLEEKKKEREKYLKELEESKL